MFEVSARKFSCRSWRMFATFPKMFLCGFMWEAFGILCGLADHSTGFYFITGLGGGIGTFTGHFIAYVLPNLCFPGWSSVRQELIHALLYGTAVCLGPGTMWQQIVNWSVSAGIGFNATVLFMWAVSTVLFAISLLLFRSVFAAILNNVDNAEGNIATVSTGWYFDLQLSVAVGLADAVFVGTVAGDAFDNNWMGSAFAVHDDTDPFLGMVKSGSSTLVGFIVIQLLLNAVMQQTWLDRDEDEYTEKSVGAQKPLESSSLDIENPINSSSTE